LHGGSKAAATVRHTGRRNGGHERVEETRADVGRRGAREARSKPGARIRGQRELRNEQLRAADVANGAVHLAGRVGKHSVGYEARSELLGLFLVVFALDTD
jgi:hypothetical protein